MTTSTVPKKDVQKLQRAIVDGLEDVKGQDIRVFDTERLSPLFERVIVASGTSNRQTKALAASVCDAVRAAGFDKPRVEGEANGEWVIVDCGPVVAHIFQPNFRTYYNLEELWGEKPVRLKLGVAKPAAAPVKKAAASPAATAAAKPASSLRRSSAAKKGVQEAFPSKAQEARARAAKAAPAKPVKTVVVGAPVKKRVSPTAAKTGPKAVARTTARAPAKSAAKTPAKAPARKSAPRKSSSKPS
jgi:ribosome-associated protein